MPQCTDWSRAVSSADLKVESLRVTKCERLKLPEYRKFSLDPQITSFEMLHGILDKAFEFKRDSDYTLNYAARDIRGQKIYLSMLSDWDMDAAFQSAAEPCLSLRMDVKPSDQELEDWDVIAPAEVPKLSLLHQAEKVSLLDAISSHVGKTMSSMQRAIGLKHSDRIFKPVKPPMADKEFHQYLDSAGYMVKPNEFRTSVYQGGIENSLRRVAWRHLLCVFPDNLSGRERFDYLKRKESEYHSLRDEWKERFDRGSTTEEVKHVAFMVKRDVLRTDRTHRIYAGGDDNNLNKNVESLFNILVTYALTHPDVSYCQGMGDLASPLLVIQKDEAQAYMCFCSLMSRLRYNFSADGTAMMTQFRHLAELLRVHDPDFYEYLQGINAHDLFFCYRWLLLQLKREFPFEDALYMLEVMWSTLPLTQPKHDLLLTDPHYNVGFISSSPSSPSFSFQQSVYTKLLAMRCSSRARDLALASSSSEDQSPDDPAQQTESFHGSGFQVSSMKEDEALDYPQTDNSVTRLQERSNSVNQVSENASPLPSSSVTRCLQQRSNSAIEGSQQSTLSLPSNELACQKALNIDNINENHLRDLSESISDTLSNINQVLQDQEGPLSAPSNQHIHQQTLDNGNTIESRLRDLSESLSVGNKLDSCVLRDIEESTDTDNSFLNISIEVGTADLPSSGVPGHSHSPFQDVEEEEEEVFNMSLDSEPASSEAKTEGEDEGYSGSRKRLPACPNRRHMGATYMTSHHSSSVEPSRHHYHRGRSDSGVSDGSYSGHPIPTSKSDARLLLPRASLLPPPHLFGNGNPFLMFSCLTLLLQHREQIVRSQMEYEDVAMFFDKMVRQHNVHKVLHQAREVYTEYLRTQKMQAGYREFDLDL
ncbi:hypothetical protein ACOMHN_065184 [Nucella lapillus]